MTGFQSIRIFGLPGARLLAPPMRSYKKGDTLCRDRQDAGALRPAWHPSCMVLGRRGVHGHPLVPGKGWVFGDEQLRELVADHNSEDASCSTLLG